MGVRQFLSLSNPSNRCASSTTRSQADFWYDTKCPNCNAGIEWQRRRLVRAARAGVGAEVADVRRRLHAVDAEGRLHVGAICAIAIWLRTPRDVWLGRVLSLPVIHPIARLAMRLFHDRRMIADAPERRHEKLSFIKALTYRV